MIKIVRTEERVDVDENDLIGIAEASRMSGRTISTIVGMMESGSLPWYQLSFGNEERKRVSKYTSRGMVLALSKDKRGSHGKPAKKPPARRK